jgi:hypothetical protein
MRGQHPDVQFEPWEPSLRLNFTLRYPTDNCITTLSPDEASRRLRPRNALQAVQLRVDVLWSRCSCRVETVYKIPLVNFSDLIQPRVWKTV